ncbi:MAG: hypothetical protein KA300_00415 [Bacteroidales bacterium]|nr:hypothetical protein [Bacteroidales bacterium]
MLNSPKNTNETSALRAMLKQELNFDSTFLKKSVVYKHTVVNVILIIRTKGAEMYPTQAYFFVFPIIESIVSKES